MMAVSPTEQPLPHRAISIDHYRDHSLSSQHTHLEDAVLLVRRTGQDLAQTATVAGIVRHVYIYMQLYVSRAEILCGNSVLKGLADFIKCYHYYEV